MMVDDHVELHLLENRQVVGLRVNQHLFGELSGLDVAEPFQWYAQTFDHLDVIEPADLVRMGYRQPFVV